jgi:small subunit ribosomal protein S11
MAISKKVSHPQGIIYIKTTFGNTLVTVTTRSGDKLLQKSGGTSGFKGARRATPYAAQLTAEAAATEAVDRFNMKRVILNICGAGPGRESAIRAINTKGLEIEKLIDTTPNPHNGCKAKKKRRI